MGEPAATTTTSMPGPDWPLRLCQQAMSDLIEAVQRHGRFRVDAWRQQARSRLAALPAVQRREAVQWLALQLRTGMHAGDSQRRAECQALVHSVDPALVPLLRINANPPAKAAPPVAGSMMTATPCG